MTVQVPRILKDEDGSMIPENSVYVSTSGYPNVPPLGLVLTRQMIPLSNFSASNQKDYYKTFGWNGIRVDDFVSQMTVPPRACFVDRQGRKELVLFRTDSSFGSKVASTVLMDSKTGLPYGYPAWYEDKLRKMFQVAQAEWQSDAHYRTDKVTLTARGYHRMRSALLADGWVNVSGEVYDDWRSDRLYTSGTTNSGFGGSKTATHPDGPVEYCYNYNMSGYDGYGAPRNPKFGGSSVADHPPALAAENPQYVYLCVLFGHAETANYAATTVIFRRIRRPEDGDVATYYGRCCNLRHYRQYIDDSVGGAPGVCSYRFSTGGSPFNDRALTINSAFSSRLEKTIANGYLFPSDIDGLEGLETEFPVSEPFYVYGWAAIYDVVRISIGNDLVFSPLEDGNYHLKIQEKARNSHISKPRLVQFLQARAEGLDEQDRIQALEKAAEIQEKAWSGLWFTTKDGETSTALENVVESDALASFGLDLDDWEEVEFPYEDENENKKQDVYDVLRGKVHSINTTMLAIMTDQNIVTPDTRTATIAVDSVMPGAFVYTIDSLPSTREDVIEAVRLGANLSVGSGVDFALATGYPDKQTLIDASIITNKSAKKLSEGQYWLYDDIENLDRDRGLAFHHVIGQKDQTVKMFGNLDFFSFRTVINHK